ncbi:MAG TPA: hypothetical protein VNV41_01740 [Candidatus Acidoferrales bacterium]|jgi:hypothetical protein|nr:hypothetical protein [Candidatus Acidoferrales bacterium]
MTGINEPGLGRGKTAFALSAVIAIVLNTVVACTKDAYHPLKLFMASLGDNDWTTQGLADVIVFVGLGLVLMKIGGIEKFDSPRVIPLLVGAVIVAGGGLFAWYLLY